MTLEYTPFFNRILAGLQKFSADIQISKICAKSWNFA